MRYEHHGCSPLLRYNNRVAPVDDDIRVLAVNNFIVINGNPLVRAKFLPQDQDFFLVCPFSKAAGHGDEFNQGDFTADALQHRVV